MKILSFIIIVLAVSVNATTITIVNLDDPGEGLNDPTVATPVGGNTGTTVGEQRMNCFERAARLWENVLYSTVEIKVEAEFNALSCNASGGVLGAAGPSTVHIDFVNAPWADTYYVQAQANSLAGVDLAPSENDIGAEFNSEIGKTGCLEGYSWYYGFDGGAAWNQIDFMDTVLHEMAHGLGFLTLVNLSTGTKFNGSDDAYMVFLYDKSLDKNYPEMTNLERRQANKDSGDLFWNGSNVMAQSSFLTAGRDAEGRVNIYAPDPVENGSSVSHWDTTLSPDELMEPSATASSDRTLSIAAFDDMGWVVIPEPFGFLIFNFIFLIFIVRRPKAIK